MRSTTPQRQRLRLREEICERRKEKELSERNFVPHCPIATNVSRVACSPTRRFAPVEAGTPTKCRKPTGCGHRVVDPRSGNLTFSRHSALAILRSQLAKVGIEPTINHQALDLAALPVCVLGRAARERRIERVESRQTLGTVRFTNPGHRFLPPLTSHLSF
jgi:hypothetical protein